MNATAITIAKTFDKAEVEKLLMQLASGKGKYDDMMKRLSYSCLVLSLPAPYGEMNASYLTKFYHALPDSGRSGSFKAWVSANSPWVWKDSSNAFTLPKNIKRDEVTMEHFNLQNAWEKSYFHKKETGNKQDFTIEGEFNKVLSLSRLHINKLEKLEAIEGSPAWNARELLKKQWADMQTQMELAHRTFKEEVEKNKQAA